MTRQLHTKVTIESADDLLKTFRSDLGVEYVFHPLIRWWQCWRWHWIVREDYQLSRAAEIILVRQISVSMRAAVAQDLVTSITEASDMIHAAQEAERLGEPVECFNCFKTMTRAEWDQCGCCIHCGFNGF